MCGYKQFNMAKRYSEKQREKHRIRKKARAERYKTKGIKWFINKVVKKQPPKAFLYDLTNFRTKKSIIDITCTVCNNIHKIPAERHANGSGCPYCNASFGEQFIMSWLNEFNIAYVSQKTFDDCVGDSNRLRFDFYLKTYNVLIEYNGAQHYKPVSFGGDDILAETNFEQTKRYDSIKIEYARKKNIPLITIPYWEKDKIKDILKSVLKMEHEKFLSVQST